jgi:hypothetical protein
MRRRLGVLSQSTRSSVVAPAIARVVRPRSCRGINPQVDQPLDLGLGHPGEPADHPATMGFQPGADADHLELDHAALALVLDQGEDEALDAGAHVVGGRDGIAGDRRGSLLGDLVDDAVIDRDQEVLPALEVLVERARRNVGLGAQPLDRAVGVPLLAAEDDQTSGQQPLPSLGVALLRIDAPPLAARRLRRSP